MLMFPLHLRTILCVGIASGPFWTWWQGASYEFWLSIPQSQFSAKVPDHRSKLLIYFCDQPALHMSLNKYYVFPFLSTTEQYTTQWHYSLTISDNSSWVIKFVLFHCLRHSRYDYGIFSACLLVIGSYILIKRSGWDWTLLLVYCFLPWT